MVKCTITDRRMQYRGYVYRLQPTKEQEALFEQYAGVCRLIWNLALEQRLNHWRNFKARTGKSISYYTQAAELTKLRKEFDWVSSVAQTCQQIALKNLDKAFQRYWAGLGELPRRKTKFYHNSFSFEGRVALVEQINRRWARLKLPKIGWVRFRITRPIKGKICEATVSKTPLGWQISFGCKFEDELIDNGLTVGIDRGVTVPIMLSDGTSYSLPAEIEKHERAARRAQQVLSRRKRGSKRYLKAKQRLAKIKARQARARKHWAHVATTRITRRYSGVVIEALKTKNMTSSGPHKRGLNRSILNVGWGQIETMLAYKAARLVKVNPAYTSQTCSSCGTVDSQSRKSQSSFVCTSCGHRDNADRNAANVILIRGSTPSVELVEARTRQTALAA